MPTDMDDVKKKLLKSMHVMSNVKVFATQDVWLACQLTRWINTTDCTEPIVTHMEIQKQTNKNTIT